MNTKKISLSVGIIIAVTSGISAQSQLTPSPNTTPVTVAPTYTSTPNKPYANPTPGSTAPYTTPPVIQQTSPPVAPNPATFPAGPTYTTTPAKRAPFPPYPNQ